MHVRPPFVLASASPRRAALLRDAGLQFEVAPLPCDESPRPLEAAPAYAERIAAQKLARARQTLGDTREILTADTTVWMPDEPTPLGKPTSAQACADMLRRLGTARGHRVTTAWAWSPSGQVAEVHACTTKVWFRRLGEAELAAYVATDAWRDKAGGYGIQAEAASWVTRLEGSYTNVVGLPVAQVLTRLSEDSR